MKSPRSKKKGWEKKYKWIQQEIISVVVCCRMWIDLVNGDVCKEAINMLVLILLKLSGDSVSSIWLSREVPKMWPLATACLSSTCLPAL